MKWRRTRAASVNSLEGNNQQAATREMPIAARWANSEAGGGRRLVVATTIPWSAQQFMLSQMGALVGAGWSVHLVTGRGAEVEVLVQLAGVTHHEVPMAREMAPLRDLSSLRKWITVVKDVEPEVLMCGTPKAGLLGTLAGRIARVPVRVYLVRGLRYEGLTGWRRAVSMTAEWFACLAATNVLAVSFSVRHEMVRHRLAPPEKIMVLNRGSAEGVDVDTFRLVDRVTRTAGRALLGIADAEIVVGFVGRLAKDKGLPELLEAVATLRAEGMPLRLLVIGGPDESEPVAIGDLVTGQAAWVTETGPVDCPAELYAAMDIFCLPSHREGFPTVVLEASSTGIPVVTTTATGCRDSVIDGETGFIVETGNASALSGALRQLVLDPGMRRRLGFQGRELVVREYSSNVLNAAVLRLLEELTGSSGSNPA